MTAKAKKKSTAKKKPAAKKKPTAKKMAAKKKPDKKSTAKKKPAKKTPAKKTPQGKRLDVEVTIPKTIVPLHPKKEEKNEVAPEIKLEDDKLLMTEDWKRWEQKFDTIVKEDVVSIVASQKSLQKMWKKIKRKNVCNKIFSKCFIKYRLSTEKEYRFIQSTLKKTFMDVFLYVNDLDNDSLAEIEEMRKDSSIEGIRNQLPHIDPNRLEKILG